MRYIIETVEKNIDYMGAQGPHAHIKDLNAFHPMERDIIHIVSIDLMLVIIR